jgi:hypothetical protein
LKPFRVDGEITLPLGIDKILPTLGSALHPIFIADDGENVTVGRAPKTL